MVVGEGAFAANQALELLEYTPFVSLCTQGKDLNIPENFLEKLKKHNIEILQEKIESLEGKETLEKVNFSNGQSQEVAGLFIAMGEASSLDFAYSLGLITKGNFIEADCEQKTNIPGVFAAGDCVGRFLQISVAVGEGAIAGKSALTYLKNKK